MSRVFAAQHVAKPLLVGHTHTMPIRPYTPSDLPALYAINQASTPGVGHEDSAEGLKRWIDLSTRLVATRPTHPLTPLSPEYICPRMFNMPLYYCT